MSIELALVPLAFAAIGAWRASRTEAEGDQPPIHHVQTRMRDGSLLAGALEDTHARVLSGEGLSADWDGVHAEFRQGDQGIWQVHFAGRLDEAQARAIVTAVDQAYGRRVQQAVVARLRERAPAAGMTIESESIGEDQSVTMVLAVGEGG